MLREESGAQCETRVFESIKGVEIPRHIHLRPGEALNIKGHVFRVEEPIAWTGASGEIKFNRCWNAPSEDVCPFKILQKPLYILPFYVSFRLAYESPIGQFSVNTLARFANGAQAQLVRLNDPLDEDSMFSQIMKPLAEHSRRARDNLCAYSFEVSSLHYGFSLIKNELSPLILILPTALRISINLALPLLLA